MRIATSFKRAPLNAAVYDAARAPQQSHLIPLKSRGRQPAGIHSFRQRSFQNIHDLLTGAQ
jgi:hypothetical protein